MAFGLTDCHLYRPWACSTESHVYERSQLLLQAATYVAVVPSWTYLKVLENGRQNLFSRVPAGIPLVGPSTAAAGG